VTLSLGKDLLGLEPLSGEQIQLILDTAEPFKEISERAIKKVPTLRGATIVNLFFEASTRTRVSFEFAEKRLSADTGQRRRIGLQRVEGRNARRHGAKSRGDADRHGRHPPWCFRSGAISCRAYRIERDQRGDGTHEHPTQGLLDMLTLRDHFGKLAGLKVCIVGDVLHSRVARSNIWGLTKMGAEVGICGPRSLLPNAIDELGVTVFDRVEAAIEWADALNVLRLQLERMTAGYIPSLREYNRVFGVSRERLERGPHEVLILHPGPMNRGVEIDSDVADGPFSVIPRSSDQRRRGANGGGSNLRSGVTAELAEAAKSGGARPRRR
jgi:aspartate carbamoyltransferase catalytic subunit